MRKFVLTTIAAGMLTVAAMGQVVIRIAPPRAVIETRAPSPGPGYIYTNGYHRWDGNAYQWTPGQWRQPPHAHAKWVEHRYDKRKGGYVFTEGHWK